MGKRGTGSGSSKTSMIYNSVEEIPEDRYLEMLLAGNEDEDLETFLDDDDEELKDEE